ncbi:MAG: histidine phosphatase family protein [Burkholderiaceae bacterium]
MSKKAFLSFHRAWPLILLLACLPRAAVADAANAADADAVWNALKSGGHVVLIRHAITEPGIGDPPEFKLDDCATQRNLSPQGRADAKRIGEAFRRRSIPIAQVLSSRWCRCLDTARIAFGKAVPSPMLDSMFNDKKKSREEKLREFQNALARPPANGNLIMVTHQQNILAFADVSPASGEIVVAKPEAGRLELVGRLTVPDL